MREPLSFIRLFFVFLIFLLMATLSFHSFTWSSFAKWMAFGSFLAAGVLILEFIFKKVGLLFFNLLAFGIFFGSLLGSGLLLILNEVTHLVTPINHELLIISKIFAFLSAIYFAVVLTIKGQNEIAFSIPFIKPPFSHQKTKILFLISLLF